MIRRSLVMVAACAAILVMTELRAQAADPLLLPSTDSTPQVRQLYDPNEPGSVLVFPKFVRGSVATGLPATEIEISVHCPTALLLANGGFCPDVVSNNTVRLRGHWVCPGQFSTQICRETDFNVSTTIEGTINFNPDGSQLNGAVRVPPAPCSAGYLIMWVTDAGGRPIKYDSLVGDAVVRWNNHAAGAYEAIAIQADNALAPRAAIVGSATGALPFDGLAGHYAAVTGTILATIKYDTDAGTTPVPVDGPSTTSLTMLTLDLMSNRPNNQVFSDLNFYDSSEFLWSTFTNFICWQEIPLSSIDPGLVRQNMSRKGFFYSVDALKVPQFGVQDISGQVTLLGLVDTVECQGNPAGTCAPLITPVTASNNPSIVNNYMYRAYDDSQPVPTLYVP